MCPMPPSTRTIRLTKERYARSAAQGAIRGAARNKGVTYADVGRRLTPPKTQSAVAHDVTDRVHPELHEAFRILVGLCGSVDGVSARAFAELAEEIVDIRELLDEPDPGKLVDRGCYLLDARHGLNAAETLACEVGSLDRREKWRAEARAQIELALLDELLADVHGIDLLAEHRKRRAA